jgi:membrane protease subunit (stomatin/prohibitin family)
MGLGEGGGGGLLAARAGMRMRSRQQYRTMSRMQRRRSYLADKMGVREDFTRSDQQAAEPAQASGPAPQQDYTVELGKLAKLRDEGVVTDEEFEAKKKQLLGL